MLGKLVADDIVAAMGDQQEIDPILLKEGLHVLNAHGKARAISSCNTCAEKNSGFGLTVIFERQRLVNIRSVSDLVQPRKLKPGIAETDHAFARSMPLYPALEGLDTGPRCSNHGSPPRYRPTLIGVIPADSRTVYDENPNSDPGVHQ